MSLGYSPARALAREHRRESFLKRHPNLRTKDSKGSVHRMKVNRQRLHSRLEHHRQQASPLRVFVDLSVLAISLMAAFGAIVYPHAQAYQILAVPFFFFPLAVAAFTDVLLQVKLLVSR